jgi:hypothetical protein
MKLTVLALIMLFHSSLLGASIINGIQMEDRRVIKGVTLHNVLIGEMRWFHAELQRDLNAPFDRIVENVLEFNERCNNDYKDKRKYTDKSKDCKHHNDNLVESLIIRKIQPGYVKEKNEVDRFLIRRNIYNREFFGYYDVVVVRKWKNEKGQRVARVTFTMLSEEESKQYLINPEPVRSAFKAIDGSYTIVEVAPKTTNMKMTYLTKTDHWLLNTWIAVGKIYKNIAKGNRATMDLIERAASTSL